MNFSFQMDNEFNSFDDIPDSPMNFETQTQFPCQAEPKVIPKTKSEQEENRP